MRNNKQGRYVMKFLLVVLVVHFVAEMAHKKMKAEKRTEADEQNKKVRHPAEFDLR